MVAPPSGCCPRQGHLVPLHAWYDHGDDEGEIRARIAGLAPLLEPARPIATRLGAPCTKAELLSHGRAITIPFARETCSAVTSIE